MFACFLAALGRVLVAATVTAPSPTPSPLQRTVAGLATDQSALDRLIDRALGLIVIDHFEGETDTPAKPIEARLCGAALTKALPRWRKDVRDAVVRRIESSAAVSREDEPDPAAAISCKPAFGGTACTVGATMEWDPAFILVFEDVSQVHLPTPSADARPAPAGRKVLRAVLVDDVVGLVEDTAVERTLALEKALKRLRATPCH